MMTRRGVMAAALLLATARRAARAQSGDDAQANDAQANDAQANDGRAGDDAMSSGAPDDSGANPLGGPGPADFNRVAGACAAETKQYCPALASATPDPHEEAICLKFYQTGLSPRCRSAVAAATR